MYTPHVHPACTPRCATPRCATPRCATLRLNPPKPAYNPPIILLILTFLTFLVIPGLRGFYYFPTFLGFKPGLRRVLVSFLPENPVKQVRNG